MTNPIPERLREVAVRTAVIYAVAAGLWIVGSDHVVALITRDPAEMEQISVLKGWLFVAVTAVLLYLGLRRPLLRWERAAAERQQAAAALQQSEERFRTFVDQAGDAFFLHDGEGRLLDVNRHACASLGYTREELLHMRVWDVATEIGPEEALARWKDAPTDVTTTLRSRHRRKDGVFLEVELRLGCFEVHGQRRFLAVARDVTERRRAEVLAEGSRRVLEMIAVGADFRKTLGELARTIEAVEPGMLCSILLVSEDGRHLHDGASPSLPAQYVAAIDGVEIGPAVGSCGTAAFRRERVVVGNTATDPLWASYQSLVRSHGLAACWSTPFFGPDRELLGTFAAYYRTPRLPLDRELAVFDQATHYAAICVTRHRAEAALRASEANLQEAQNRLRSALEIGGIGTFVVDFERNQTIWDEPLKRVYGRAWRAEDGADPKPFLDLVHPDDRERVKGDMERAVRARETPQSEYRVLHPGGEVRWVATTARAEYAADGRPARLIGATVDITARKSAEENYRQAQKLEAIGQLSGGIAHDFNNLLTVIQAGVSFLELEKPLSPSAREFVAEIKGAATRAANLTRQLLTFSRRQAMQLRRVELNEIVTNMSRMLQRVLGEHIQMELRLAPHDLHLCADAGMIEQVVMNLAVNARDAMPEGGRLTISTGAIEIGERGQVDREKAGPYAVLEVADAGVGIADAVLPHIFEPFFTTKEPGRGTGLGLATVQGIVDQHGGWVEVRSRVGDGTTFRIHLPRVSGESAERESRLGGRQGAGHETILLVEDEEVVRALVRNLLVRSGYRVIDAATGPRALELWNSHGREIDLLVTDLIMPDGMSGSDLAERLRREQPALRVIFTSGYSPEVLGPSSELREGAHFLAKPFDLEELTIAVRAALDSTADEGPPRMPLGAPA